jgi:hypothetical protein
MNTYIVEFYDSYQGPLSMDIEANSLEEANEIFIRSMLKIPTGVYLKN